MNKKPKMQYGKYNIRHIISFSIALFPFYLIVLLFCYFVYLSVLPVFAQAPSAWFQAEGGDIYGNGVDSEVPGGEYLSKNLDGYSGVVISGSGDPDSTPGDISESNNDWKAGDEEISSFFRERK